jgi:acyl-CoA thioester hydrolase
MIRTTSSLRVRYPEVDRMGVGHHTHFFVWFEIGRTELLRSMGCSYGRMEDEGIFMPVVEASCRYRSPVRYDDNLEVETTLDEVSVSRVSFSYLLRREGSSRPLAEGRTVHATVDRNGEVMKLPLAYRKLLSPSAT